MNAKRILASILSFSLIGMTVLPITEVQAKSRVTQDIPEVMIEQMGRDVQLKDFIRPIYVRDVTSFLKKMKTSFTTIDASAHTLTSTYDLALLDSACTSKKNGSIGIAAAKLNGEDVTLLTLGGTCFKEGQASGLQEDLLSALEQSNHYLRNIVDMFNKKDEDGNPLIPSDKPIIVTGISLGGMVAQQLLAQKDIMKNYDIKHVICFGSPLLAPFARQRQTRVVRFCDSMDIIPYLGKSTLIDMMRQEMLDKNPLRYVKRLDRKEAIVKDGGYKSPISAHMLSYIEGACWQGYDALGVYGGNNEIVMLEDLQFFENNR